MDQSKTHGWRDQVYRDLAMASSVSGIIVCPRLGTAYFIDPKLKSYVLSTSQGIIKRMRGVMLSYVASIFVEVDVAVLMNISGFCEKNECRVNVQQCLVHVQKSTMVGSQRMESHRFNIGVSKNRGTPKWMVYNGKPY